MAGKNSFSEQMLKVIFRDAGTKKGKRGRNFKKAHCNYFELKPKFIDAQWATARHSGVFRITLWGAIFSMATNAYTFMYCVFIDWLNWLMRYALLIWILRGVNATLACRMFLTFSWTVQHCSWFVEPLAVGNSRWPDQTQEAAPPKSSCIRSWDNKVRSTRW